MLKNKIQICQISPRNNRCSRACIIEHYVPPGNTVYPGSEPMAPHGGGREQIIVPPGLSCLMHVERNTETTTESKGVHQLRDRLSLDPSFFAARFDNTVQSRNTGRFCG